MTSPDRHSHLFNAPSADTQQDNDIAELLSKRFGGISIYVVVMLLLAAAIIWTGVLNALQTQHYLEDYQTLQDMKSKHLDLQIERQRLLIEQQTFSATPQIAARAVAELKMFSPTMDEKIILQPVTPVNPTATNNATVSSTNKQNTDQATGGL